MCTALRTHALTERYGNDLKGFTKFVGEQYGAYRRCFKQYGEAGCILRFESLGSEQRNVFTHCEQLFSGMYATHLR